MANEIKTARDIVVDFDLPFAERDRLEVEIESIVQNRLQETIVKLNTVIELLAVIHADGGQYTMRHGYRKSTDDAIDKYLKFKTIVEDES